MWSDVLALISTRKDLVSSISERALACALQAKYALAAEQLSSSTNVYALHLSGKSSLCVDYQQTRKLRLLSVHDLPQPRDVTAS